MYDTQEIKERNTVSLCKGQVELNILGKLFINSSKVTIAETYTPLPNPRGINEFFPIPCLMLWL